MAHLHGCVGEVLAAPVSGAQVTVASHIPRVHLKFAGNDIYGPVMSGPGSWVN